MGFSTQIILCTVLVWLYDVSHGQDGSGLLGIPELSSEDVARIDVDDGAIEDWIEVVGEPVLTALDFYTYPGYGSYDPSDFDFRIWLGWNKKNTHIYCGLALIDDDYVNLFSRPEEQYRSNRNTMEVWDGNMQIYVDGDHSGEDGVLIPKNVTPETYLLYHAQFYTALGVTYDDGPHLEPMWSAGAIGTFKTGVKDWFLRPPYAYGGGGRYGENPTVAVTECYMTPFDLLDLESEEASEPSVLAAGKVIGFHIVVTDASGPNVRQPFVWPDPTLAAASGLLPWGDAMLLSKEGSAALEPDDTSESPGDSLASDSWGRIKASLF